MAPKPKKTKLARFCVLSLVLGDAFTVTVFDPTSSEAAEIDVGIVGQHGDPLARSSLFAFADRTTADRFAWSFATALREPRRRPHVRREEDEGVEVDDDADFEEPMSRHELVAHLANHEQTSLDGTGDVLGMFNAEAAPGGYVLVTPPARGKSALSQFIAKEGTYIRFGEPEGGQTFLVRALFLLTDALIAKTGPVVLDSIRELTLAAGGAATEGGISASTYTMLASISAVATRMQRLVFLAWNPLVDDGSDKFERVVTATVSSATGVLWIKDASVDAQGVLRLRGRQYLRLRSGRRLDADYDQSIPLANAELPALSDAYNTGTPHRRGDAFDPARVNFNAGGAPVIALVDPSTSLPPALRPKI